LRSESSRSATAHRASCCSIRHVQVASADLLRQKPVVISFFRGHW
jgi:hypothetical protein